MPNVSAPNLNGLGLAPEVRRVLDMHFSSATAAINQALVMGQSVQVAGPFTVTATSSSQFPQATVPTASTTMPAMDGTASAGTAASGYSCGNHVHPTDTSRVQAGKCNTWPASTAASVNLAYASDCNAAPAGWAYYNSGTTSAPSAYGILHTVSTGGEYATPNAGSIWIQQTAYATDSAQPWVRQNINNGGWSGWQQLGVGNGSKGNGTATIGATATSVTVSNAAVTASSVIQLTPQGSLAVGGTMWVVPAAGSFTIRCDAAPGGSGLTVGYSIMS